MSPAIAHRHAAPAEFVNRRLATGLLLSILVHGVLLLLQFGVPGLGVPAPSAPQPISVKLAPAEPQLPPVVAPSLDALPPLPLPPLPAPPAGMRVIAPAPEAPKAPVAQAVKPKRSKPRRISRPLPPRDLVETPTRVIAQDNKLSDFALPMPQPAEAQQQTTDPKEAQDGADDGVDKQAALLAEAARKEDEQRVALQAAEEKAEQDRLLLARQADALKLEQQRRADELAVRRQADERESRQAALRQQQADERAAQEQLRRQQADELALRQRAQQQAALQQAEAARQRTEEVARQQAVALQQAEELARRQADQVARQQAEQLAKQVADEAARRQAEQLARQQAEQAARRQAEQDARQQAEQAARQQADEAARRQAEQLARQQAEQAAAAGERALAASQPGAGTTGAVPGGAGAGGSGSTVPKNLLGSDMGNRVRELTRGIDLLKGAPPQRMRDDPDRGARRLVSGGAEQDVPVRMYVDSFRQKVERNGGLAFAPRAADAVRIEPLVSVALRSDGSVEDVTIVRSSGHAETDNAVRRIIRLNARYSAFPPNIANRYDVIEIRRIWSFAESLRLLEELR